MEPNSPQLTETHRENTRHSEEVATARMAKSPLTVGALDFFKDSYQTHVSGDALGRATAAERSSANEGNKIINRSKKAPTGGVSGKLKGTKGTK